MRNPGGKLLLVGACLVVLAVASSADTIYLKNGQSHEGKILSESGGKVRFRTSSGVVLTLERRQIDRIEKGRTKLDEYEERLEAIAPGDVGSLFELVKWCDEAKLYSQKKKVLTRIRKVCPGHPETRRALRQIWKGGKWAKAPKDLSPPPVVGGDRVKLDQAKASLVLPRGWKARLSGEKVVATGPDRYAIAPVLTVEFGVAGEETATAFPEKEGWEKCEAASAGGMTGHRSRRGVKADDLIDRSEVLVLLASGDRGVRIQLTCLDMEEGVFAPAIEMVLRSLTIEGPKADYVNTHYGYALNLPKPLEKWPSREDDEHDLQIFHERVDATDHGNLWVVAGNEGEELTQVQKRFDELKATLTRSGDCTEEVIDFCGQKATLVDGTYLDQGVPCRMRLLLVKHGKRLYVISFDQHEFGQKKTNSAWDTVIGSFRFTE